jgi:hypothetical protein
MTKGTTKPALISSNEWVEMHVRISYGKVKMSIGQLKALNPIAGYAERIFQDLVRTRFTVDGEDKSGRQKAREREVQEIVAMSFDAAQAFYAEVEKRGLIVTYPTLAEQQELADKQPESNS